MLADYRLKQEVAENKLIEQMIQGDKEAFESIFYKYNQSMLLFAKRELKAGELAEDSVQNVFVTLWEKRSTLRPTGSIKGFLFTCLKNQILNAIRTKQNIILKHTKFTEPKKYVEQPHDNQLIAKELNMAVGKLLSEAPSVKKRIFELSLLGYKNKDISEKVNLSTNTVKMYLSGMRKAIKSHIAESNIEAVIIPLILFFV
ncbi:MAG: sigma-70 family RNA polymerase sigma factor [Cyclobacteriaceae bacterium]